MRKRYGFGNWPKIKHTLLSIFFLRALNKFKSTKKCLFIFEANTGIIFASRQILRVCNENRYVTLQFEYVMFKFVFHSVIMLVALRSGR